MAAARNGVISPFRKNARKLTDIVTTDKPKSNSLAALSLRAVRPALRLLTRPSTLMQLPRLLTEGMGPVRRMFIQAHNQKELTRLVTSGSRVNFISSFARSGNTWTRNLLADALLQAQGIATDTDLPVPFQEVVADYYCDPIGRRHPLITMGGILVKTHDSFAQLQARIYPDAEKAPAPDQVFGNCRVVYLYRSPEDVLVSLFHLQRKAKYLAQSRFGIDEFCRSQLPHWLENLGSYLRACDDGVPVYFVSYEGMLQEPAANLAGILQWLEIPHDSGIVERAVAHMGFENIRAREERALPGHKDYALRRGKSGGGLEELQPQTRCYIRETAAPLLKQAQKRLNRQISASAAKPAGGASPKPGKADAASADQSRFASSHGLQPT